jgi:pimeloyl-ACP methyl ester carboxylesterase
MRYTRQGISLEYDDIGNGVPLLLIHGFPLDRTLWRAQIAGLASSYRVVAPDLRGFGQSSETTGEAVSMEQYAADLKSLLDSLNIKQAVVGGISMGGYIALAFYAQFADRVKGLLLANTRATSDTGKQPLKQRPGNGDRAEISDRVDGTKCSAQPSNQRLKSRCAV